MQTALSSLVILFGAVFLVSPVWSEEAPTEWSVLQYDERGVAVGVRPGSGTEGRERSGLSAHYSRAVEPGQLLLVDPTEDQLDSLAERGFRVSESHALEELEILLVELLVPETLTLPAAMAMISEEFPDVMVNANDLLELQAGTGATIVPLQLAQSSTGPFDRTLSGWGTVPETCGTGISLGQIDGVVDESHPALRGRRLVFKNFLKDGSIPAAANHGTAVAIMLIGRPHAGRVGGLLPGATLYAANIFERRSGRNVGNLAAMLRAVDWLLQQRIQVANLSISGLENSIMRLAIQRAHKHGLMIVAAAGNNGANAPPSWPAAHPDALAVTAVDQNMVAYDQANHGDYIDFAAPGVGIETQTPRGPQSQSGTSFATPYITAMVAIHLQAGFDPDPDLIRRSLVRYTMDLGQQGKDRTFGFGMPRLRAPC